MSLLFCFYFDGIPVVPYFVNIEQFKQDGIMLRQLHKLREISSGEVREAESFKKKIIKTMSKQLFMLVTHLRLFLQN